jgi:predicted TIM-barrel fold metal-dependent hydrolase
MRFGSHPTTLFLLLATACTAHEAALRQEPFEKIDVHTHYFAPRGYLVPLLERWRARAVILNYSMGEPDSLVRRRWAKAVTLQRSAPDRFLLATTFDATAIERPDFAVRTIARLEGDFEQGAVMVKVWKDLGLQVRDRTGTFVQIDDPRLQPIWDFLSARHVPVLVHSADPREGWRPLDPQSVHYQYFSTHPANYPYAHPEMPGWDTIIAARDRWLARNPNLTVIGAHLGSMADDLDALGHRLDSYPNFNVDVSARYGDLRRLPANRVRRFFLAYQDRILFGTDRSTDGDQAGMDPTALREEERGTEARFKGWWDYLSRTLRLPPTVLRKFYSGNAIRLLHLSGA